MDYAPSAPMAEPFSDILCPALAELSSYTPVAGDYAVRLDANEAPELLSAAAKQRLAEAAATLTWERYPDATSSHLRQALAGYSGVSAEEVLVGDGSDEIITMLLSAFSQARDRSGSALIMTTTPSFVMYRMSARVRGQRVLEVPLDANWDLALESMLRGLEHAPPNLIFIATPNNPTGNLVDRERLERLIQAAPELLGRDRRSVHSVFRSRSARPVSALRKRGRDAHVVESRLCSAARRLADRAPVAARRNRQSAFAVQHERARASFWARWPSPSSPPKFAASSSYVVAERERLSAALGALPGITRDPQPGQFPVVQERAASGRVVRRLEGARRARAQLPSTRWAPRQSAAGHDRHERRERPLPQLPARAHVIRGWLDGLRVLLARASCAGCAVGSSGVTRMADGVRYEGRFVNPEAYAAYLLGVEHEARGEFSEALAAYLEAHAEDPDSPEIWARIGAVRCISSEPKAGPAAARAAFERGLKIDPAYYGNYFERARCAERAADFASALARRHGCRGAPPR